MSRKDNDTPMLQPRFTGIPTFMRTPIAESFDELDIALIGISHGSRCDKPGRCAARSPGDPQRVVVDAQHQHFDGHRALQTLQCCRCRRCSDRQSLQSRSGHQANCVLFCRRAPGRRHAIIRRWRSFGNVSRAARHCVRPACRRDSHRCAHGYLGGILWLQVPPRRTVSVGRGRRA